MRYSINGDSRLPYSTFDFRVVGMETPSGNNPQANRLATKKTRQEDRSVELTVTDNKLQGMQYKVVSPMRSFFSPTKGIPLGTTVILTGEFTISVSTAIRFNGTPAPKCSMKVGIKWGQNLKGTDWVTEMRFRRCAKLLTEKIKAIPTSTSEEIKKLSYRIPRRRR